jgi:hypothetical protein
MTMMTTMVGTTTAVAKTVLKKSRTTVNRSIRIITVRGVTREVVRAVVPMKYHSEMVEDTVHRPEHVEALKDSNAHRHWNAIKEAAVIRVAARVTAPTGPTVIRART